jgi:hypothetical protein
VNGYMERFFRRVCSSEVSQRMMSEKYLLFKEPIREKHAQQSVHRTAGGLRILSMIQAKNLIPFRELVLPAAGNAGRWAAINH